MDLITTEPTISITICPNTGNVSSTNYMTGGPQSILLLIQKICLKIIRSVGNQYHSPDVNFFMGEDNTGTPSTNGPTFFNLQYSLEHPDFRHLQH